MPFVDFEKDEMYPVYYIVQRDGKFTADLSDAEIADFNQVSEKYHAWMDRLEQMEIDLRLLNDKGVSSDAS